MTISVKGNNGKYLDILVYDNKTVIHYSNYYADTGCKLRSFNFLKRVFERYKYHHSWPCPFCIDGKTGKHECDNFTNEYVSAKLRGYLV